LALAMGEPRS